MLMGANGDGCATTQSSGRGAGGGDYPGPHEDDAAACDIDDWDPHAHCPESYMATPVCDDANLLLGFQCLPELGCLEGIELSRNCTPSEDPDLYDVCELVCEDDADCSASPGPRYECTSADGDESEWTCREACVADSCPPGTFGLQQCGEDTLDSSGCSRSCVPEGFCGARSEPISFCHDGGECVTECSEPCPAGLSLTFVCSDAEGAAGCTLTCL